ncbi:MAG: molybdopterin-guanine dinucleotide biosynthesis protein B [Pseudomonadota bacterium]
MKVFGVVGWKDSGKTGLVERLVATFVKRGLTVSTVKHAHHDVDVDQAGRDTHRHREAGASEVLLATPRRWALMHELRGAEEPSLEALLKTLSPADLVLVEGFKREGHAKIETHRAVTGADLLASADPTVRAIASDVPLQGVGRPVFRLDDTDAIAEFIINAP